MTPDIRILGLGNVLMGDDGLGPYAVEVLRAAYDLPAHVSIVDVGTPGLDLTPFLSGADEIILIDTVRSDGAPGELRLYRREQILRYAPMPRLSPHDPGIKEALITLDMAGQAPKEVFIVGVIPESCAMGPGLTDPVRRAVPGVLAEVFKELIRHGITPRPKASVEEPNTWWEAPVERPVHA
jgi:hydrogenase maturation protease